ncbi:MAG: hypothetical protein MUC56_00345 [Thermoanaerobaculales bacterium]|nr:hypothetical protein [Thermoanaerobaculales bacterium]
MRILTIVVASLAGVPAIADDVHLRGGGQITGQIVEQTEKEVVVDIGGGTISAPMSSVVSISKGTSPLQEYRDRAATLAPDDAEAWRELARWATDDALASQAEEAWQAVLTILPDDEEANRALGRVLLDGRWVTEEESYRARGYVELDGEWMTPAERQAILADRQARADADRQANEVRIREIEAEQRADEEREAQEAAAADDWAYYGTPTYWGWGTGPAYWPARPRATPYSPAGGVGRGGR